VEAEQMKPGTKQNLTIAMQNEALAHAKYSRFAARARMEGDWELARTFQDIADSDRTEYFAKEAELIGLGADTGKNLRTAIEDHSDQVKMYTRFKDTAAANGDAAAAALFEKVLRDKVSRRADLEAALGRLGYARSVHMVGAELHAKN
jgi:rubrerythrin